MSLIAEMRLTSPELPLIGSLSAVPNMQLRVEQAIAEHPEQPILFLWASGDDFTALERSFKSDSSITEFILLEDAGERRLYRVQISKQADVVMYPTDIAVGASRLAVTATARGLDVRMRFPDRDALCQFRDICGEQDICLSLRGLYEGSDSSARGRYGLSSKQQRTLRRASESGYYRVPRETGLDDLADDLDISRQAVSERLRRGTDVLIQNTFETTETDIGMYQNE
jgi:predicted DNA binding protein